MQLRMLAVLAVALVAISSSAAARLGDASLGISNASYFSRDGGVVPIAPSGTLALGLPGRFRAEFAFATADIDPTTGHYVAPDMSALWSVKNSHSGWVGEHEWVGLSDVGLLVSSFDTAAGEGIAELDIPIAQTAADAVFPPLPKGGTTLEFALGNRGALALDAAGQPNGVRWTAQFHFNTQYPSLFAVVENRTVNVGDRVLVNLIFNGATQLARTCTVSVRGRPALSLAGSSETSWALSIPAFTRTYSLELGAQSAGLFRIRATLDDGSWIDTQICEVLDGAILFDAEVSGLPIAAEGPQISPPLANRQCVPAEDAGHNGDIETNCTGWYVELLGPPPNPNCGSSTKGRVLDAHCERGEGQCQFNGTEVIQAAKYVYAGAVDRDAGSVTVGMSVTVDGEANFFLIKKGVEVEGSVQVESKLTRRCCKFIPAPGTVPVRVKKCG